MSFDQASRVSLLAYSSGVPSMMKKFTAARRSTGAAAFFASKRCWSVVSSAISIPTVLMLPLGQNPWGQACYLYTHQYHLEKLLEKDSWIHIDYSTFWVTELTLTPSV